MPLRNFVQIACFENKRLAADTEVKNKKLARGCAESLAQVLEQLSEADTRKLYTRPIVDAKPDLVLSNINQGGKALTPSPR
jgi:hypothetical protein